MKKPLTKISENISELEHWLKTEKDNRLRERIHMLYLIKSEKAKTRISIAQILSRNRNTIGDWLDTYEKEGLSGLLTIKTRPNRKNSIPPDVLQNLEQKLRNPEGFKSYKAIQVWIQHEFSISVPYQTLHRIVRYRLKAKPKVGRKSHIKKTNRRA
jgi:transposase